MSVLDKLASSLKRRDETPNVALAKQISDKNDRKAVSELIGLLDNKNKEIQSDSVKVLYETGERKPALLAGYAKEFVSLLDSKDNRLQWGAMTALNTITLEDPKVIYSALAKIIRIADEGSVITRDNGVKILLKLCTVKQYEGKAFSLFLTIT